ncbi:extracellular solute-binding protein [Cellulomonas sp. NPDC089187]|uniref:ABC transporter substrate-binding protein n=1 Tax=Cellulomonas sp. NPDC089187 TaxID=3154970 RepID=UPI003420F2E5
MRIIRKTTAACAVLTLGLGLAACADAEETGGSGYDDADATLTEAARERAEEIAADYDFTRTSITMLSDLGGDEMDQFLATFAPFEEATGITLEYESTRDLLSVLSTRVQGGNPPDLTSNPSIGQMQSLMASGDLVPLDDMLDMDTIREQYNEGLLDLASDEDGQLYGLFTTAALKGLIYYNPETYDGPTEPATWSELTDWTQERADSGTTPWCIGLESGAASGWPATDWIEQFMLSQHGTEVYDSWMNGELAWTSPEVTEAFEAFIAVTTDQMANGGPTGVVSTNFLTAADPMYDDPARCDLHLQADWMARTLPAQVETSVPGQTLDFFQFPAADAANAGTVETAGELLGAFNDDPEVQALVRYAASVERNALLADTGLWISPNTGVSAEAYPTVLSQRAAEIFTGAESVRFDASDYISSDINQQFWAACLTVVKDPSALTNELNTLEQMRTAE